MKYEFEIPCPHEKNLRGCSTQLDHHPITDEEIRNLLNFARDHSEDVQAVAKAQVRLVQAVPEMTCPRPASGEVARKCARLERVFANCFGLGGAPDLVEAISTIIRS